MHKGYNAIIRDKQGNILRREMVDSETIKPLLGPDGKRPQPPYPAYMQMLYGVPVWYGTTDDIEEVDVDADEA